MKTVLRNATLIIFLSDRIVGGACPTGATGYSASRSQGVTCQKCSSKVTLNIRSG
jgi:hypothetical protein